MTVHQLQAVEADRIPDCPGWMVVRLTGSDGAVESFAVEQATLEQIVEALDAELVRLRARDARQDREAMH